MARIPRSNNVVNFTSANMPYSSGGGYSAVGRAKQQLGNGTSDLGRGIGSAVSAVAEASTEGSDHLANLELLKWANQNAADEREHQANYTGTGRGYQGERSEWFGGREQALTQKLDEIGASPRLRQKAQLFVERERGSYQGQWDNYGYKRWQGHLIGETDATITGEVAKLSELPPDQIGAGMERLITPFKQMIDELPGLSPSQRESLHGATAQKILETLQGKFGNDPRYYPIMKQMIAKYVAEARTESKAAATGSGPIEPFKGPIFIDRTPSRTERVEIQRKGGIVVNLDTNWAKGDKQTSPMVVIPDNAAPEQRQAAEAYASKIADVYKQKFGTSLSPRVVTRSQNIGTNGKPRGRPGTIHTEPFAVTDSKAVAFFNSPEGQRMHAGILRDTFGKIPGVHFSLPHDPYGQRRDHGAAANGVDEVKLARPVLEMLRSGVAAAKSDPMLVDAPSSKYTPAQMPDVDPGGEKTSKPAPMPQLSVDAETAEKNRRALAGGEGRIPQSGAGEGSGADEPPQTTGSLAANDNLPDDAELERMPSGIKSQFLRRAIRMLPAMKNAHDRAINGMIEKVEDQAAKGIALPDDALAQTQAAIASSDNPQHKQRLAAAMYALRETQALQRERPEIQLEYAKRIEESTRGPDGVLRQTPETTARIEYLRKLAANTQKALNTDAVGYATQIGLIPKHTPPDPSLQGEQLVEALRDRREAADFVAQHYGRKPQYFNDQEVEVWSEHLRRGGDEMLDSLETFYAAFGSQTPVALQALSKSAPEVATIGWMLYHQGEPKAISDAAAAIKLKASEGAKFKSIAPSQKEARSRALVLSKGAFTALPVAEQNAIDMASLIYETRARRAGIDPANGLDTKIWDQSFQAAMGQTVDRETNTTYGGVGMIGGGFFHGKKVVVPPTIETDSLDEVIDLIRVEDLAPQVSPDVDLRTGEFQYPKPEGSILQSLGITSGPDADPSQPGQITAADAGVEQRPVDQVGTTSQSLIDGQRPPYIPGHAYSTDGKPLTPAKLRSAQLVNVGPSHFLVALGDPDSDDPQWVFDPGAPDGRYVLDLSRLEPTLRKRASEAGLDGLFRPYGVDPR